jgi:hypothetical protein
VEIKMTENADVKRTVVEAKSETNIRLIELKGELKDIKFAVVLNLVLWLLFFLWFVGKFTATR